MRVYLAKTAADLGQAAAEETASRLQGAITERGEARLVVSTGASQFELLDALVALPVDWSRVTMFHLDEYLGMDAHHLASFRKYLQERILDRVPMGQAVLIAGDYPRIPEELDRVTALIRERPIDVSLIGIGENGHVAFNDPPADFAAREAYRVVTLDDRCKQQQVGEGWFPDIASVPDQAISMTVHQILQTQAIISAVPGKRKAQAVRQTLESPETPDIPATVLKRHPDWSLYIDQDSGSELNPARFAEYRLELL